MLKQVKGICFSRLNRLFICYKAADTYRVTSNLISEAFVSKFFGPPVRRKNAELILRKQKAATDLGSPRAASCDVSGEIRVVDVCQQLENSAAN